MADLPFVSPSALSDDALIDRLRALGRADRRLTASLILHLCEFDSRKLYGPLGFPSLFAYCVEELGYSEDVACKRIIAARAAERFPSVITMIDDGRLTLSTLVIVAPALTPETGESLLAQAAGCSKREAEALAARFSAAPAAADRMRWLDEESVELRFVVSRRAAELLDRAREISRHVFPEARYGEIVERSLDIFLEKNDPERRRSGRTTAAAGDPFRRYVPEEVKRAVWQRDEGRCAYVSQRGRRCSSRAWLEFDHIEPWAKGGRSDTAQNIRLLCRAHNQMLGRRQFGEHLDGNRPLELPLIIRPGADNEQADERRPPTG